MNQGLMLDECA